MELSGHIVFVGMSGLPLRMRCEPSAVQPKVEQVEVVGGRLSLAKAEDVDEHERERQAGDGEGRPERKLQRAEEQQQRDDENEDSADADGERLSDGLFDND